MPKRDREAEEKYGPLPYENLGTQVQNFRRVARVRPLTREERQAHGQAVEEAVRAAQRRALVGPERTNLAPPSIARLLRYEVPIPMIGDPRWNEPDDRRAYDPWARRAKVVYAAMMGRGS